VPLSHGEQTPVTQEQVWSGLRGHRRLACAARKRELERQISEDAQVEQYESLTHNMEDQAEDHPEEEPLHPYPLAVEAEAAAAEVEAQASHLLSHQVLLEEN
jgi:hypothetical protein